ncbi:MAG: cobalamin-dependent protein [candidate division WOR-3 bacterium]|nr:MAG: cobalamin-dependent protein [candidate division WOR-3 bacterium]
MIDILLVNPKETGGFFEKMPPLGLAHIAVNLERHGFSVKIVDLEVEDQGLYYWLSLYQPRFVGISGTSHTRFESFRLAMEAKNFNKEIVTIYGGVHATFTARDTLKNIKEIDFVVRGEGEKTTVELLNCFRDSKKIENVRGISYRDNSEVIENQPTERIKSLDSLGMPAYHLLNMTKYYVPMEFVSKNGISLITSRGCLYKCSFCSASRMFNYEVTTRSAKNVVDEIEFLFKNYGFQGIKVFDSTLTIKRQHIDSLCDEIVRRDLDFPWECEIKVGTVDRKLLEKMKHAGCYYVNFGIESASQKVLNLMRKGMAIEQAEKLLELCNGVGMKTKVFFSFGHIGETMDDVEETFAFIDKHQHQITAVASGAGVRIYPGTYLEMYARKNEFLPHNFEWSLPYHDKRLEAILQAGCVPVLIQPRLGFDELEEIALRIFGRRFRGWKGFKMGIKKITDMGKLKKLIRLLKLRFKNVLRKRRHTAI